MYLRTVCPSCREEYELSQKQRGHKVRCPECDTLFAPEVEEVPDDDEAIESSKPARNRRKRGKRPRRLRRRARFTNWPLLAVVGLCVLSVLVAGAALLVYALRGH
jgi:predicted Zn finger-like uncharacterized protein